MAFPPFPTTFAQDIMLDAASIWIGPNGSGVLLGRSIGGINWEPTKKIEPVEFDGMRAPIVGLDRITDYAAKISGKLLQYGSTPLTVLELGIQSSSGNGIVGLVYSMQPASALFSAGSYGTHLRCISKLADGSFKQIHIPYWLCTMYKLAWKDKKAAEIDFEFSARINPAAASNYFTGATVSTDDAPYGIETINAGTVNL